jgi:four helix bundle protein
VVWNQLVRAADSTSSNLIEADNASSKNDFLYKMGIALREARESQAALVKLRLGSLDHFQQTVDENLESEAGQLGAIFASIILNMRQRLDEERRRGKRRK